MGTKPKPFSISKRAVWEAWLRVISAFQNAQPSAGPMGAAEIQAARPPASCDALAPPDCPARTGAVSALADGGAVG